jgi:RNA polymerase-binding transcription factor DksA
MTLDAAAREKVERAIRTKLGEVARLLEAALAGQDVRLDGVKLPQEEDPSEPPVERLRRFMRLLDARLKAAEIDRCTRCGGEIGAPALGETPWADVCRSCAN